MASLLLQHGAEVDSITSDSETQVSRTSLKYVFLIWDTHGCTALLIAAEVDVNRRCYYDHH